LKSNEEKAIFRTSVMLKYFLTPILLIYVFTSFSQIKSPDWLRGNWYGNGFQTDNNAFWPIEVQFDNSDEVIKITYPSLNCGGNWKLISVDGNKADFVEMISEGKTNCIDGSRIVLSRINEENIHVTWFSPHISGADAFAVISRKKPEWLNGKWDGRGFQPQGGKSLWSVNFSYNSKTDEAQVSYPSLACSGNWKMVSNEANRVIFKEVITIGKESCIDGSEIIVHKIDDKFISVTWLSANKKQPDAFSTLEKRK